jgi:inner membrane protein
VLVRDQRGIAAPPSLKWGNIKIPFQPGSQLPRMEAGMFAKLPEINLE